MSDDVIRAERQEDGTYLLSVPYGTDISKLAVNFSLPYGATVDPASGSVRDFSAGPLSYTITAEDQTITRTVTVAAEVLPEPGVAPEPEPDPQPEPEPQPEPDDPEQPLSDGGGCNTGAGVAGMLGMAAALIASFPKL